MTLTATIQESPKAAPPSNTEIELWKCEQSCAYFIHHYAKIYDAVEKLWIPFRLWRTQKPVLSDFTLHRLVIVLKARQLGLTWMALAYALWRMLFHPIVAVALFSKRDDEAMYLLGDERMRGMYDQLPLWMQYSQPLADSGHNWMLPNGSSAKAFPTSAGDSYTFSLVIVDEADLASDLGSLMRSVKPTIDGGGQMIMISRSDKDKPQSEFKNMYRAAKKGENGWRSVFLPWYARPSRDSDWYDAQKRDILARTGFLDDLYEQYPATDSEALAPKIQNKRIPPLWLRNCYVEMTPLVVVGQGENEPDHGIPAIPGLRVYKLPEKGKSYKIGIDPAEGNPTSDDSALTVIEEETGEEVAAYRGKVQPSTVAAYADKIGTFYNNADILCERNNHGHAVILWLDQNSTLTVVNGEDKRPGWLSNTLGKTRLYDEAADTFREQGTIIHDLDTLTQLQSIEGSTLRAPSGQHDDLADSYALALIARSLKPKWRSIKFLKVGQGDDPENDD